MVRQFSIFPTGFEVAGFGASQLVSEFLIAETNQKLAADKSLKLLPSLLGLYLRIPPAKRLSTQSISPSK